MPFPQGVSKQRPRRGERKGTPPSVGKAGERIRLGQRPKDLQVLLHLVYIPNQRLFSFFLHFTIGPVDSGKFKPPRSGPGRRYFILLFKLINRALEPGRLIAATLLGRIQSPIRRGVKEPQSVSCRLEFAVLRRARAVGHDPFPQLTDGKFVYGHFLRFFLFKDILDMELVNKGGFYVFDIVTIADRSFLYLTHHPVQAPLNKLLSVKIPE